MARESDYIEIDGAAEHNLKGVDVRIPKKKLVIFTGPSGSGKSSLAFDTIYAEGQRRYVESLSAYARQFLGQLDKPQYDRIRGLSPTISIEQKSASNNPRSTVGTITEIYDYLRVLYARIGKQVCPSCSQEVEQLSAAQISSRIASLTGETKLTLLSRLFEARKGEHRELLTEIQKEGFTRLRINGDIIQVEENLSLDKRRKNTVDVVIDRLIIPKKVNKPFLARLTDSVEVALRKGRGVLYCAFESGDDKIFSEDLFCQRCDSGFPELTPQSFSFNSPIGMCEDCNGLGTTMEVDPDLVIPDPSKTIREGAIEPWTKSVGKETGWTGSLLTKVSHEFGIDFDIPWKVLPLNHRKLMLYGSGDQKLQTVMKLKKGSLELERSFEGVLNDLYRRFRRTKSEWLRRYYSKYLSEKSCKSCGGQRLREESRAVLISKLPIHLLCGKTILEVQTFLKTLKLSTADRAIARDLVKEIDSRLTFLLSVGLGYLTLDRPGPSLSGGESQRIRLASQIGSELTGVLYILDEPSIGLHQRDNKRLLSTLRRLRDFGNTVIVVEHDAETIETSDYIVDFGPGAGIEGGEITFSGTPKAIKRSRRSITGQYLSGRKVIETPSTRRSGSGKTLKVTGAKHNNLKNVTVSFPLETMIAVTGVSGAGKSSLINGVLFPAVRRYLNSSGEIPGAHRGIHGIREIDKVIDIDQKPIGRTSRSNPATYTKIFDEIRRVFAQTSEARMYGFSPGRFSFNVKGGRCEACQGDGVRRIEMHFLSDVFVKCEVCQGFRFNEATLRVRWKGLNISEVLNLSVSEAFAVFENQSKIAEGLQTLRDVGLDYIKLGQTSPTLSGGEAQRIKLARELSKRSTGKTLYILDEPTTGLHFDDLKKLLTVLNRLVDEGNTVIVIEHNLDVIRCSDHVIDIGPEGGAEGGEIISIGTPEELAKSSRSHTGKVLRGAL